MMEVPDLFSSWNNSWWTFLICSTFEVNSSCNFWWRFLICLIPEMNAYYWFISWISLIVFSSFHMLESLSWIPNYRYYHDSKSGIILDGNFHLLHVYFVVGHSQFGPSTIANENHDELLETNYCYFCKYPTLSILILSNYMRNLTTLVQIWRIHIVFLLPLHNIIVLRLISRLWSGSEPDIPVQRYTRNHFQVPFVLWILI